MWSVRCETLARNVSGASFTGGAGAGVAGGAGACGTSGIVSRAAGIALVGRPIWAIASAGNHNPTKTTKERMSLYVWFILAQFGFGERTLDYT